MDLEEIGAQQEVEEEMEVQGVSTISNCKGNTHFKLSYRNEIVDRNYFVLPSHSKVVIFLTKIGLESFGIQFMKIGVEEVSVVAY